MQMDFQKQSQKSFNAEKIAQSLYEFCNCWCKRGHVECDALKDWELNIFKLIDRRIFFYSQYTAMLPCKPGISYRFFFYFYRGAHLYKTYLHNSKYI